VFEVARLLDRREAFYYFVALHVFVLEAGREYCQWENFNASCPGRDEVVLMTSARYGRIRFVFSFSINL